MTVFVGVDLAWSGRKPTGLCVLEAEHAGVRLVSLGCSEADWDAARVFVWLSELGADVVAGIDAPLVVGPGRMAEAAMARVFGRQGVYAYSARMDFLERRGIAQGPLLGGMLAGAGWNLDPADMAVRPRRRHALEVFPHATIVSLLGAPAALKYKKGRLAGRLAELAVLQSLLRTFCERELPGIAGCSQLSDGFGALRGAGLKALEDQLDAVACAVSAYHAWRHGTAGMLVFGDARSGYISVPRPMELAPAAE